jgi:hypothetical protein
LRNFSIKPIISGILIMTITPRLTGIKFKLSSALKTLYWSVFRTANFKRWQNLKNYDPGWDERTKLIGSLIPQGSRVIEFGAGRRQLELYLDSSCIYFSSDLVSRSSDTIVCNLNSSDLPNLKELKLDVAVFSGVLEYISDLDYLAKWLAQQVSVCIASYVGATSQPQTLQRIQEMGRRMSFGWFNTYSDEEIETIFNRAGFHHSEIKILETPLGSERIFIFKR